MRKKVPLQPASERVRNFFEVALGFSKEDAEIEARRCLQCKNPECIKGCPVEIDIPAFIKLIKENQPKAALEKINEKSNLPAICGRVCPQEDQCEALCVLNKKRMPVNIGALERYAADFGQSSPPQAGPLPAEAIINHPSPKKNIKVAIVGSGPAGLTCAADLARMGYAVTLFESLHIPGGVLVYGIPEFRLPKKIVKKEVEYIKTLGVEIRTDTLIGYTHTIEDLFNEGYKAIFAATGAGLPQFLGIPGENLNRVYTANEFLTRINLMKAHQFPEYHTPINIGKKVAVIGGGNVAVDCARVALRLGRQVYLIYRRTEAEMPARIEEIENAREEGIVFKFLTQPARIIGDEKGFVKALECIKMELGAPDESGRKRPVPVRNSEFIINVDTIVIAIGQNPNPLLPKATPQLRLNPEGTIHVDNNLMTSIKGVFAGGDITSGADTVIQAMGAGKRAAKEIDKYLKVNL